MSAVVMHQNRLMSRFRDAGATAPKLAVTPEEVGCRRSWTFRRMAAGGVFIETENGRYYMDEDAALRFVKRRWRVIFTFLTVVIVLCLIVQLFD